MMFEVRPDAAAIDTDLVARFQRLGYRVYHLVPGLGLLAPLDGARALDPFTLNLFACRDDRAQLLERRGLLARAAPPSPADDASADPAGAWLDHLRAQLFAAPLWPRWSSWIAALPAAPSLDRTYASALDHFAIARQITEPPARRLAALTRALDLIRACAREQPTLAVLQSFARIAADAGERAQAAQALSQIVERCMQPGATLTAGDGHARADADADLGCPFLAVSARFDDIAPIVRDDPRDSGQELLRWVTAAALEQRERLRAFSSFYTARDPATLAVPGDHRPLRLRKRRRWRVGSSW